MRLSLALAFLAAVASAAPPVTPDMLAREALANLNAGRFEAVTKDFNADMRRSVTPQLIARIKREADAELGAYQSITKVTHRTTDDGFPSVDVTARYEKGMADLTVVFDNDGRIGSMIFQPLTLERTAREFFVDFREGRFDAATANFNSTMRTQLPSPRLQELSSQITQAYGAFRSLGESRTSSGGEFRAIEIPAQYEREDAVLRVVFDRQGKIAGVTIAPAKR